MATLTAITAALVCGLASIPIWSVPLAALALATLAYAHDNKLYEVATVAAREQSRLGAVATTMLYATIATGSAYGYGALLHVLATA